MHAAIERYRLHAAIERYRLHAASFDQNHGYW